MTETGGMGQRGRKKTTKEGMAARTCKREGGKGKNKKEK